ncbi:MAG: nitroreductase family protein [Firmicutes bacterium]|nr:nitroreductase family protein [Bacillota bacterium]
MNTLETICTRKSVRSYTGESLTDDELERILKAANASPAAMGKYESLHITVIKKREMLDRIESAAAEVFGRPDSHPLYGAPLMILISSVKPDMGSENAAYSNAAIITENIALEATELKLGVCQIWGAVYALSKSPEILSELGVPDGFIPCCAVILGKTDYEYTEREIPTGRISQNVIE